jgi:hypothetical protein
MGEWVMWEEENREWKVESSKRRDGGKRRVESGEQ